MESDTVRVLPGTDIPDRERVLDWITALIPITVISLIYYRWSAAALEFLALGGYMMATVLLARPCGRELSEIRIAPGILTALLAVFCLPSGVPWWLAALIGGLAAVLECAPVLIGRFFPASPAAKPVLHPSLTAYLLIRLIFPGLTDVATMPAQWSGLDGAATATPLRAFAGEAVLIDRWQLFFGMHAGAIGETCAAAILLTAVYLIIRRRIRLIAPAALLATVSLLSWIFWNSPLYALLSGGLLLAALMLADTATGPVSIPGGAVAGVIAGLITVLIRRYGGWTEGVAVGVLVAQLLTPFFPVVRRFFVWLFRVSAPVRHWIARTAARFAVWVKPYLCRARDFLAARFAVAWQAVQKAVITLWTEKISPIFAKKENNS